MKKCIIFLSIAAMAIAALSGCSSSNSDSSKSSASDTSANSSEVIETTAEETSSETPEESDTESSDSDESNDKDVEEAEKNIEVKAVPTEDDQLCVFITNKNDFVVDELEIEAVFYDKDGKPVDTDSDGHDMILPGATVVSGLDLPSSYDKYEINVTVELGVNPSYQNHAEKVEVTQNTSEKGAIAQVTNNDTVTIEEVELKAVFYNGDKIVKVTFDEDITDLRAGKTETVEFMCLDKFDKAEIYLNQAHTFGL